MFFDRRPGIPKNPSGRHPSSPPLIDSPGVSVYKKSFTKRCDGFVIRDEAHSGIGRRRRPA
jgi:hypothetical protein